MLDLYTLLSIYSRDMLYVYLIERTQLIMRSSHIWPSILARDLVCFWYVSSANYKRSIEKERNRNVSCSIFRYFYYLISLRLYAERGFPGKWNSSTYLLSHTWNSFPVQLIAGLCSLIPGDYLERFHFQPGEVVNKRSCSITIDKESIQATPSQLYQNVRIHREVNKVYIYTIPYKKKQ